ncbi:hypothetical protein ABPG77_001108 [Micractinium sp. CCAP 211/92]
MRAMAAPQEVQEIVAAHAPHFSVIQEDGRVKIKCELNGHTFPARAEALEAFVSGKKYAKLVKDAQLDVDLKKYEPFIVRSKNLPGMLFCALTGELLNARLHEVKAHLKGRKFGRARERFEADEQELLEEPDLEEEMDEDEPEGSDGPGFWVPEEVLQEYEMADAEGHEDAPAGEEQQHHEGADSEGEGEAAGQARSKAGKQEQQPLQKQPRKQQRQQANGKAKGGEPAAADGGKQRQKATGGDAKSQPKGKQQKQQGGKGSSAANGSAKAKAPKAKRARTG